MSPFYLTLSDCFDFQIKLLENKLKVLSKKQKSTRDAEDSDSSFQVVSKPVRIFFFCDETLDELTILKPRN